MPKKPAPAAEPASDLVTLVRMEGKLDLIADRVSNVVARVDRLETESDDTRSRTQTLEERMAAEATKAIALAAALKEADEARRAKSDDTWTPFARVITALLCCFGLIATFIQLSSAGYIG